MKSTSWDSVAEGFDETVFNVLANDRKGLIRSHVRRCASPKGKASDLGCGVGRFVPMLAENFALVHAVDISEACLDVARRRCAKLDNVRFAQLDLGNPRAKTPKADFALSVNTLIMPSLKTRMAILRFMKRHVVRGGRLLLVVPSLESALFTDFRLMQWNLRSGLSPRKARRELRQCCKGGSVAALHEGILDVGDVATKHYLEPELHALLAEFGFKILALEKIEYSWKTEFANPPKWMKKPGPWDWLALTERTAGK